MNEKLTLSTGEFHIIMDILLKVDETMTVKELIDKITYDNIPF